MLALLPLGFVLIHPRVLKRIVRLVQRTTHREVRLALPTWGQSTWLVLRLVPSWVLLGATSVAISAALGSTGSFMNILSAVTVSWVIGFLALPSSPVVSVFVRPCLLPWPPLSQQESRLTGGARCEALVCRCGRIRCRHYKPDSRSLAPGSVGG